LSSADRLLYWIVVGFLFSPSLSKYEEDFGQGRPVEGNLRQSQGVAPQAITGQ
jgi:hypothetical protein